MNARLDARLTKLERRLQPERWVTVVDSDELEAAGYYLVRTDEELTGEERYFASILPLMWIVPSSLPPGLIRVRRDELDDVMARMHARPWIVRVYDSYEAECGVSLRELYSRQYGEQRVREMEAEEQQRWREICDGLREARQQGEREARSERAD